MSLQINIPNIADTSTFELKALVLLLNTIIVERGGQAITAVAGPTGEIPANPKGSPDVRGASDPSNSTSDANASGDDDTAGDTGEPDSAGVYWDARIHSETKGQNKDKTWRLRRNVDKDLVAEVLAEQKNDAPDLPDDGAPELPDDEAETDAPDLPEDDGKPDPTPEAEPIAPADVIKFTTTNNIDKAAAEQIYQAFGLKNAGELFKNKHLCADVLEALKGLVG